MLVILVVVVWIWVGSYDSMYLVIEVIIKVGCVDRWDTVRKYARSYTPKQGI